jgi:hypothetical protein
MRRKRPKGSLWNLLVTALIMITTLSVLNHCQARGVQHETR